MNAYEKQKCLELTISIDHKELCKLFRERVDPIKDGAPDYCLIISNCWSGAPSFNQVLINVFCLKNQFINYRKVYYSKFYFYSEYREMIMTI